MVVETVEATAVVVTQDGRRMTLDPKNPRCRATQTTPRYDLLKDLSAPVEPLALDIEFQEFRAKGAEKWGHRIGRIAFVNTRGETIYDTYCRYEYDENIDVKMPPAVFGVGWNDTRISNGAKWIRQVNTALEKIMANRTIIGHGMRLDRLAIDEALWSGVTTVDTQGLYGQRKLEYLADEFLGESIQQDYHSPVEDARATMLLYLLRRPYKMRTDFSDVFVHNDYDFPSLENTVKTAGIDPNAKAPSIKNRKKGKTKYIPLSIDNI